MRRTKLCSNLTAMDSHILPIKLPVIFEMDISTVPRRVKSRPLHQCCFGNNNTGIRFLFPCAIQNACHSIIPIKAFGIQPYCLTDSGIQTISREEIFADSDFICQFWEPPLYQFHLVAGNIHHVAVAVHIRDVVSLRGMFLAQQIIFSHTGKLRQLFQNRNSRCVNTTENRFISICHLITLDLCNRNRYNRCKTDKERRQSDCNHHHQVPAFLTCEATLCQLFYNGTGIIFKRPCHVCFLLWFNIAFSSEVILSP